MTPTLHLLLLVLLALLGKQSANGQVARDCTEVQCAPNFVCVLRNTGGGLQPFCVPGNSAGCSTIQCPAGQTCTFVEQTNCGSATCPAVPRCTPTG
ncbi:hypothetical protein COOONC_18454 [Cooperia oncophora]